MISLEIANKDNKNIISNLLQFYMFELNQISKYKHFMLANTGKYHQYPYFENYWDEQNRFPYIIKHNDKIIGFSLVHDITLNSAIEWKLAEFFILPEFRRKNLGLEAAVKIIKSHQGSWEISILEDNLIAQKFWLSVFKQISPQYKSYIYEHYKIFELHI